MENKKMSFAVDASSVTLTDLLGHDFCELHMRAISSVNPNLNDTWFTPESMRKALPTFRNKPILGYFGSGDFEQHNGVQRKDDETGLSYWDTLTGKGERILGVIRSEDKVEVVEDPNVSGLYWTQLSCALWTQYAYEQIKRLFSDAMERQKDGKGAKSISVEVDITDGEEIMEDGKKILKINSFVLDGITILGSQYGIPVTPAIQGASLFLDGVGDDGMYAKRESALRMAYAKLDSNNKEAKFGMNIKLDKSKEAMSDKAWGSVDKTALRNKVVGAENAGAVVHSIYLQVGKGWKDAPSQDLKYPVMEVKEDGTAVYNRGGLAAAKGYAEKNGDQAVLSKVNGLYKKLGLDEKKENESYCGDAGFAKLCDMCKDCLDAYAKFDGECEPDEDDEGDEDGKDDKTKTEEAAKCAADKGNAPGKEDPKEDPKSPKEDPKNPADRKDPKAEVKEEEKNAAEPKPGKGDPDPKDPLQMKGQMSEEEHGDEEHPVDPVSDMAALVSDYGWRGQSLVRTIAYYEKAEGVPGKEYVLAMLKKFKAINDSCLAEAAGVLKKAAEGFTQEEIDFAKRCAEHCSCGGDLKECDKLSAKCAELEKKCADSEAKCSELDKKCSAGDAKCADLEQRCAAYAKKELCDQARALLSAANMSKEDGDTILKACEGGELKTLEDVKNKAARLSFDAHFNANKNTVEMPIVNSAPIGSDPSAAEAKGKGLWESIHDMVH